MKNTGKFLISTDPGKGYEEIGRVPFSSENEVIQKIAEARMALLDWKEIGTVERIKYLEQIYKGLETRREDLCKMATREMGMPISDSYGDFDFSLNYFRWYLDHAAEILMPDKTYEDEDIIQEVYYEPIGVAAVIVPWNFPLSNFAWRAIQPMLAGNVVVFKTSEEVPMTGKIIEDIFQTSTLPKGVFSEVYGDGSVGEMLVNGNVDLICFTGSTKTGKLLYEIAGRDFKKISLELGGSAPGIVFEDANIDRVLESIYVNRFGNCGQICDGLKRLIVHKSKLEEVLKKLEKLLEIKKVGLPEKKETNIGPLAAERQKALLMDQIEEAKNSGAVVAYEKKIEQDLHGAYVAPMILINVKREMKVWREEVFGPVLPVLTFETEEEAINLANDTSYGLGSYVFTENKERFERVAKRLQAGMVQMNNASYVHPATPFGGYKYSGVGRSHGKHGFWEMCQIKSVAREK